MAEQRTERGGRRRWCQGLSANLGGGEAAGEKADRGGFNVAFAAGDLAGKTQARLGLEAQGRVEQERRVEEGVAVESAEARELGV